MPGPTQRRASGSANFVTDCCGGVGHDRLRHRVSHRRMRQDSPAVAALQFLEDHIKAACYVLIEAYLVTVAPFSASQITGGPFLPSTAGPWKWAIVAGPESPL